MKTFVVLVLTVTALFLWQRNASQTATTVNSAKSESRVAARAGSPQPVSNGDWMKHSLDRAHDVARQVQTARNQGDQP